jgi:pimeloyl-ACP methyl ester carboxylesterase
MQKTILFRGGKLNYEIEGNGLSIMLLHGFTEDRQIWEPVLTGIKKKFQWILPDLPGSGESPYNASLSTLKDFAEAIYAIIENENIKEFVLIGHSMGGYISLSFTEKYPEKIKGLGLFHSSSYPDSPEKKDAREKSIQFIQKNGATPYVEQAIPGLFSEGFKAEYPEQISKLIDRYANFSEQSIVQYLEAMKQRLPTTMVLKSINKPVLFIIGEEDKAVPVKDQLEQCYLPRISYIHILTQTAHMGMIENTSLCNKLIDRFLEQIPF